MPAKQAKTPLNVITGFLGSGKTTLLGRLLRSPDFADTAVLINEFGEIGLDHFLIERLDDTTVMLQSGCICCTIRGDLSAAVRKLHSRRERGEIPAFRRVIVETTGLADPVPVLATITAEPVIRHHFRLGTVVATVDAVNGQHQLDEHEESVKQAAIADRLVLTKTDLADAATVAALHRRLLRLNPTAVLVEAVAGAVEPSRLLAQDFERRAGRAAEVRHWLAGTTNSAADDSGHGHDHRIQAFCVTLEQPIEWAAFGLWLSLLLHRHGNDILRVKGILNVVDASTPVAIHGVQHIIHQPTHLAAWPGDDRRSRIVFIARGLSPQEVERSLRSFQNLGDIADTRAADPSEKRRRIRSESVA